MIPKFKLFWVTINASRPSPRFKEWEGEVTRKGTEIEVSTKVETGNEKNTKEMSAILILSFLFSAKIAAINIVMNKVGKLSWSIFVFQTDVTLVTDIIIKYIYN